MDALSKIETEKCRIDGVLATLYILEEAFEDETKFLDNPEAVSCFVARLEMFSNIFGLVKNSLCDISDKIYEAIEELTHEQKAET